MLLEIDDVLGPDEPILATLNRQIEVTICADIWIRQRAERGAGDGGPLDLEMFAVDLDLVFLRLFLFLCHGGSL